MALLHLLRTRPDLTLHIAHLDHETRGQESTGDAQFVADTARSLGLPCTIRRRSELEPLLTNAPANLQARYRLLRLTLFRQVIQEHQLTAVLQAHHADDQAETILMRLIRGTGIDGLSGIAPESHVQEVRILRPLLPIRRQSLRQYLVDHHLPWREDSSNAKLHYLRNQVRQILVSRPELVDTLLTVAATFSELSHHLETHAPALGQSIPIAQLRTLPPLIQLHSLRHWLLQQGTPADDLSLALLTRLRTMIEDSASPPAITIPGGLTLRRKAGQITVTR
jgi:tRNA(Ile)-lysidine synthase